MGLLRNRDYRRMMLLMFAVSAGATAGSYFISPAAPPFAAGVGVLLMTVEYLFSRRRYKNIASLSEYLKSVNAGQYSLAMNDHAEGELSILKSEIYKTTVTLCVQAEELKKEKTQLADAMSDISHQLKTPLTSMLVMTDLLCDADLPADKRTEFTGRIKMQLSRIEWLLTSLLKLSRIDAGSVTFNRRPITVSDLLQRALQPLLIPMELRSQHLLCDIPDITFDCDPNWTAEALLNILKNCVEHTPVGGELRVTCTGNALYTQILIADNGTGIDPSDLPYIFNRFYRGKNSGDDSVGIGLSMARSVITSQGGVLTCESEPGRGTAFTIKFFG